MTEYVTRSGSTYQVDDNRVRRVVRGALSESERVSEEWRDAEAITCPGVGHALVIVWGTDQDAYSASAMRVGQGDVLLRTTVTTPVVAVTEMAGTVAEA